jgi:hypothetical protein
LDGSLSSQSGYIEEEKQLSKQHPPPEILKESGGITFLNYYLGAPPL